MSKFPLYDELVSKMDGTEISLNKNHCNTITRLAQEHLNIIYLIILHHHHVTNNNNINEIPYGGKTISNGKGVIFKKLSQIPVDAQKIIYKYLMIMSSTN
jgi:hypothetical protein